MTGYRFDTNKAVRHLVRKDPVLGRFIKSYGPFNQKLTREADLFLSLSRAIVYQQLSGKAAQTIYGRFEGLFKDKPNATDTLAMAVPDLRAVGLSNNKALAVLDLAAKSTAGELPSRRKILRMADDAVLEALCQVRGIGPWTAQMYLMFNLGRPDVMPATDLGVQKGLMGLLGLDELPSPDQLSVHAEIWRPYRTVASWYLWRVADTRLMAD